MASHPILFGFIVSVVVAALLGVATYHAARAWQAWRADRAGEAPEPPFVPRSMSELAASVERSTEAIKRLGEAYLGSRDWLSGVRIKWWRAGLLVADGESVADQIVGPATTTRPYDWAEEVNG